MKYQEFENQIGPYKFDEISDRSSGDYSSDSD